jgi:hypothetical protein
MTRRRWVKAELEALCVSAALIQDSVLGHTGGLSVLAASLAEKTKKVENQINTAAAHGVRWGTRSALVAALSHFLKLEPDQELHGSGWDADLSDDRVDALWPLVSASSNLLV